MEEAEPVLFDLNFVAPVYRFWNSAIIKKRKTFVKNNSYKSILCDSAESPNFGMLPPYVVNTSDQAANNGKEYQQNILAHIAVADIINHECLGIEVSVFFVWLCLLFWKAR